MGCMSTASALTMTVFREMLIGIACLIRNITKESREIEKEKKAV